MGSFWGRDSHHPFYQMSHRLPDGCENRVSLGSFANLRQYEAGKPAIFVRKGQIPTILTQQQQCSHRESFVCYVTVTVPHTTYVFMLQPYSKIYSINFCQYSAKKNQWRFLQILAKIPSKLRNYMNMKYSQPLLATRLWAVSLISLCSTSHFQVSPEMFNQIPVWALAGPLNDIHRVVLKQLSH